MVMKTRRTILNGFVQYTSRGWHSAGECGKCGSSLVGVNHSDSCYSQKAGRMIPVPMCDGRGWKITPEDKYHEYSKKNRLKEEWRNFINQGHRCECCGGTLYMEEVDSAPGCGFDHFWVGCSNADHQSEEMVEEIEGCSKCSSSFSYSHH